MNSRPKVSLYVPFFEVKLCQQRKNELYTCLRKNNDCNEIDQIFLVLEDPNHYDELLLLSKVTIVRPSIEQGITRQTFNQLIDIANCEVQKEQENHVRCISIICNADIYFNDVNLSILKKLAPFESYSFALSRWDVKWNGLIEFFDCPCSQDTWIFDGIIKEMPCNFSFGMPGIDNRLATILIESGYTVLNVSKQLQSFHLHISPSKTYNESMRIHGKYTFLPTCNIPKHLIS